MLCGSLALTLPASSSTGADTIWAEEEGAVFFPTRGAAHSVEVEGRGLSTYEDQNRTPYLLDISSTGVHIRLTDWVGCLHFEVTDASGTQTHTCLVAPTKLAPDHPEAFRALARLTDAFPHLTTSLRFPQELMPAGDLVSRPLPTPVLLTYAGRAGQLWQEARRQPRPSLGHTRRIVEGGVVPDRVDWAMTLDHWGEGGLPAHVARQLSALPPPQATAALHDLWYALIQAARLSSSPDAPSVLQRFHQARAALPLPVSSGAPDDALTRTVRRLSAEVRGLAQQASGVPQGWTRMASLYELWAMLTFASSLGVTEGSFGAAADGLYEGTLQGRGLTIHLNPKLSFRGTGAVQRSLRPDLLLLLPGGEALVADVKYRPLHRQPTEWRREVDDQLLRYMGLAHARSGLVLWPSSPQERLWQGDLPGGRAQLARLRLHPFDTPQQRVMDLQQLGLPGVT